MPPTEAMTDHLLGSLLPLGASIANISGSTRPIGLREGFLQGPRMDPTISGYPLSSGHHGQGDRDVLREERDRGAYLVAM